MTETVLVTGATGTTGSALVSELVDAGVDVRGAVHSRESAGDLPREVDAVEVELTERETLGPAFEGVDRAYLLTPLVPDQIPLVENLVDAAVAADVDHLVRHSARGAGEDDPFPLAASHREAERRVEETGIDYTHVRPTAFMQNVLGEAESVRREGAIYQPVGEPISFVDARDVAAVAAAILTGEGHAGETYTVTGPEALTYGEVADVLSDVLDREVSHVQVSMADAREAMLDQGMPEGLVEGLVGLQEWFAAGNGRTVSTTVADLTGRPARTFREFATEHAAVFAGETN